MYWLEVSVECDGEAAEAVAEVLQPLAHGNGVVLEQRADLSAEEEGALEPQVTVKIYLPGEKDTPDLRQGIREAIYYLGRLYPIPEPQFRKLEDKDWAEAWKEHYHPFRVGKRLWIQPSWQEAGEGLQEDDIVLTLDPGMAFGTGLHPTTQMCLQAVEEHVQEGMRVLDVGTGSGILAIAAARLGAAEVLAIDTDPLSVEATVENAGKNGVAGRIEVRQGTLSDLSDIQEKGWDVVVVNILAPVIVSMLESDALLEYVAPQGYLLLSGIIDTQFEAVQNALQEAGGRVENTLTIRDWVAVVARRQDAS
jgi:ribosomal protein L11 methyltransferase